MRDRFIARLSPTSAQKVASSRFLRYLFWCAVQPENVFLGYRKPKMIRKQPLTVKALDAAIAAFDKSIEIARTKGSKPPSDKRVTVGGVDGLHVYLRAVGGHGWCLSFEHPRSADGKRQKRPYALGPLRELSLADAREKALKWRELLSKGIDPRSAAKIAGAGEMT